MEESDIEFLWATNVFRRYSKGEEVSSKEKEDLLNLLFEKRGLQIIFDENPLQKGRMTVNSDLSKLMRDQGYKDRIKLSNIYLKDTLDISLILTLDSDENLRYYQARMHPDDVFSIYEHTQLMRETGVITPIRFHIERVAQNINLEDLKTLPPRNNNMSQKTPISKFITGFRAFTKTFMAELSREDELERKYKAGFWISQIPRYKEEGIQMMREAASQYEGKQNYEKSWLIYNSIGDNQNAERVLRMHYLKKYGVTR